MRVCGKELRIDGRIIRTARLAADRYEFLDDPEAALDAMRTAPGRIDLFTFIETLTHPSPRHPYPFEWDNVAALRVSTYDHWLTKQVDRKVRNMVKKAAKSGVDVREMPVDDDLFVGISRIYDESPIRQGRPFWHFGKDLETVRRENGTFLDRSVFIGAFHGNELIGFAKLVSDEHGGQAGLMQILSMIRHRDKAPTNALIAYAVRACAERHIEYLVYANFAYGNKRHDSLSDFKLHNGFQRVDVPRYHVALTRAGRIALRLGLHRPLSDRIPEWVVVKLRKVRSAWTARRVKVPAHLPSGG